MNRQKMKVDRGMFFVKGIFIIYTGAETEIDSHPEVGVSGSVVLLLMTNYLKKNHIVFGDNWYSSPLLFER